MPSVSFQAPTEYSAEAEDIARRRKYAELLQAQSIEPLAMPQTPAGGFAVPISPLAGLAKMLQAYTGAKGQADASAQQKALGERYRTEGNAALAKGLQAYRGTPGSSETIMDETAAGGMGQQAQINAPAVGGSPDAAMAAWGSHPQTAGMSQALLAQMLKQQDPYTLAPGAVRMGPGNAPVASAPFKPPEGFTLPQGGTRFGADGKVIAAVEAKPEAPHTRTIQRGDQKVSQEFDPAARTWADVPGASGPAFARQVVPVINVGGGKPQKAPVGYRFSSDGETLEPIPGGPKDASGRPLPTQALKLQQAEVDAIGGAATINADLAAIQQQVEGGKLKLSLARNVEGRVRNVLGVSDENSRNLATFKATLERLRNESLRLNKGVQTEGDAVRAWNELFENINDTGVVKQRLAEIQKTNDRAIDLRKMNIDNIRKNYGAEPLDTSGQQGQPPAVGAGTQPQRRASDKAPPAPAGVDPKVWAALTPEERALWK